MPSEFKIRGATEADAEAMTLLTRELGYPAEAKTTLERLKRILNRDDHRVVVALAADGTLCGWLQAHCSDAVESGFRVEIVGLVVSERMRRKGVGRRLVACAETWATEIAAETLVVRSNAKRIESHVFYPALGYLPAKTQVVYRKRPGP